MRAHGGVDRGRSHGGEFADDTQGTTDGNEGDGNGAQGADGGLLEPGDTGGPGIQGRAAAMRG